MDLIQAIVYGIVQGLTEWLPISSTAHLRLIPALLGWSDPGAAFTAAIQMGTLLAVLIYFAKDLSSVLLSWVKGFSNPESRQEHGYKLGWGIVLGTVPVIVLGVLFKKHIENDWRSLYVIAATLIGMGILLAVAEKVAKKGRTFEQVTLKDGVWVGLWQAVALIPGASRSGSCLTGALFAGIERAAAARFAFLLSVPSVLAAGVYSIYNHRAAFTGDLLVPVLVANMASFVVGYATIAFLMKFLQRNSSMVFVVYRIVLGLAILGLLQSGTLKPDAGMPPVPVEASNPS